MALCLTGGKGLNGMHMTNFIRSDLVNLRKSSNRVSRLLLSAILLGAGASLWAQQPRYVPPPPPTKHTQFQLRLRYMLPPDVGFKGLGSVSFLDNYESSSNDFLGTERYVLYDDGFIAQDYNYAGEVEGSTTQNERIPSPNTDGSTFFSYSNPEQLNADDPTKLTYHRYASEAPDEVFEGSGSGAMGWEINYTKYINRKRNIGLQVGFAFDGYDSRFNETIGADLIVASFVHEAISGIIPDLGEPDDDGNYTSYLGDRVTEFSEDDDRISWLASEESIETLIGEGEVDAMADFRSSLYNFKAGPTYNMAFNKYAGLQLGAGVNAVYFTGRFSAYEILMNPTGSESLSNDLTTTEEAEWQVGGYLDANAYYNLNERVSLFSGAQVQSGSSYTQYNEERQVDVDFSTQVFVHAGVGIKF